MARWLLSALLAGVAAQPRQLLTRRTETAQLAWEIPSGATFKSWFDRGKLPAAADVSIDIHKSENFLFGKAAQFTEFNYWAYRIDGDLRALDNLVDFADRALEEACPEFVASRERQGCPHHKTTIWSNVSQFNSLVSAAATILDTEWPATLAWHRTPQFYQDKASSYVKASAQFIFSVTDYDHNNYVKDGDTLPSKPWNQISRTIPTFSRLGRALTLLKNPAYEDALEKCKQAVQGFVAHWANATIQQTNPYTGHDFVEWAYQSDANYKELPELKQAHNGSDLSHGEDYAHGGADIYGLWSLYDQLGVTSSSDRQFLLDQLSRASVTAQEVMQCRDSDGKPSGLFHHNMCRNTRPLFGPTANLNASCQQKMGHKWNLLTVFGPVADELHDSLMSWRGGGGRSYTSDVNVLLPYLLHNQGRVGADAWFDTSPIKPICANVTLMV